MSEKTKHKNAEKEVTDVVKYIDLLFINIING